MRLTPALLLATGVAALAATSASAHPGHVTPPEHAGLPGFTSPFVSAAGGPSLGGLSSPDIEFVTTIPQHSDTAGGRKHGSFFYVTTERDLTIYDVSTPVAPRKVGSLVLPKLGTPVFTEEDPDTNGEVLLVSNGGALMVIDVRDKTSPRVLSTLEGTDEHTISCILDCTWAYGSEGAIVDLRDPLKPRRSAQRWRTTEVRTTHDVTEVEPGIVLTSSQPMQLLDARKDPERPVRLGGMPPQPGRFVHANRWPNGGKDDLVLVGGEATGPRCAGSVSATFSTWDGRALRKSGTTTELDSFRIEPGSPLEGRAPDSTFCVHWFDEHPDFRDGGLVAIGWYEHGTHILKITPDGQIEEVAWHLGLGGQASAAYWIDERTIYVADYVRGLDVLRYTGPLPERR